MKFIKYFNIGPKTFALNEEGYWYTVQGDPVTITLCSNQSSINSCIKESETGLEVDIEALKIFKVY